MANGPDAEIDFGVLLSSAGAIFGEGLVEALTEAGFPEFTHWFGFVLRAVDGQQLSLRQLAERMEMSSPGALKIVTAMEGSGYLTRSAHPDDARIRLISPTPRGLDALAVARRFHQRFEAELVAEVGSEQAAATRAALTAVVARGTGSVPKLFRPA